MAKKEILLKKILKETLDLQDYVDNTYDEIAVDVRKLGLKVMGREMELSLKLQEIKEKLDSLVDDQNV